MNEQTQTKPLSSVKVYLDPKLSLEDCGEVSKELEKTFLEEYRNIGVNVHGDPEKNLAIEFTIDNSEDLKLAHDFNGENLSERFKNIIMCICTKTFNTMSLGEQSPEGYIRARTHKNDNKIYLVHKRNDELNAEMV